jgi:hypothetical protein
LRHDPARLAEPDLEALPASVVVTSKDSSVVRHTFKSAELIVAEWVGRGRRRVKVPALLDDIDGPCQRLAVIHLGYVGEDAGLAAVEHTDDLALGRGLGIALNLFRFARSDLFA